MVLLGFLVAVVSAFAGWAAGMAERRRLKRRLASAAAFAAEAGRRLEEIQAGLDSAALKVDSALDSAPAEGTR
jgi:hypothetical protein